jgi:SNF2 family DNA or RNA helicase/uncharacterized Zn finger protein
LTLKSNSLHKGELIYLNWQSFFQKAILRRGQRYYQQHKVRDLHYDQKKQRWIAQIRGSQLYQTEILVGPNGDLAGFSCTCPYAASGLPCKHEAAMLFALEDQGQVAAGNDNSKEIKISTAVKPTYKFMASLNQLISKKADSSFFFDLPKIMAGIKITDATFKKAKDLEANQKFTADTLQLSYAHSPYDSDDFSFDKKYLIIEAVKDNYQIPDAISVAFKQDGLFQVRCDVCGAYRKFCKHTAVLLLELIDVILQENPGDFTDYNGFSLMENWQSAPKLTPSQSLASESVMTRKTEISLLPQLINFGQKSLALRLKIGEEGQRLYQVKNLADLLDAFASHQTIKLGKNHFLKLQKDWLTAESLKIYQFLQRHLQALLDLKAAVQFNDLDPTLLDFKLPGLGASALLLGPAAMDDFFELFKDQEVLFQNPLVKKDGLIHLQDQPLDLTFKIQKIYSQQKVFQGLKFEMEVPQLISGQRAGYYLTIDHLYRFSQKQLSTASQLFNLDSERKINAVIGKEHLGEFYYDYLPQLQTLTSSKMVKLRLDPTELPPQAKFEFLLDMDQTQLNCQAIVFYGQQKFTLPAADDLGKSNWYHNNYREEKVLQQLQQFFVEQDRTKKLFYTAATDDQLYQLLTQVIPELQKLGTVKVSKELKKFSVVASPKISVGVKIHENLLDLKVSDPLFSATELQAIFQQYQLKKKYYRLPDGRFVDLQEKGLAEIAKLQKKLNLSAKELFAGHDQFAAGRAFFLDQCLKNQQIDLKLKPDQQFQQLIDHFEKYHQQKFQLPSQVAPILRSYQKDGYQWLRALSMNYFGGILADEMGLGKTLQLITLLLANQQEHFIHESLSLIVTPASLIYNWQAEFTKFAPELQVVLIAGSQTERQQQLAGLKRVGPAIVITSYDLLKRDLASYQELDFGFEVIDEAQYIKNPRTAAAKAVKKIKSRVRFALTGTPIENGLSELWSIFDFLLPGFLGTYRSFREKFENPIIKDQDSEVQQNLNQLVAPFILRRLKKQVLKDLPQKTEQIYLVEMEKKQQALYHSQVSLLKKQIQTQSDEEFKHNKIEILAGLTRLREICCDPSLIFENYQQISAKRQACLDLVEQAVSEEHKVLIFSQFTSLLNILAADLKKRQFSYYEIFGSTPKKKRLQLADAFNQNQVPVFLISLKAGGTGLNLTGADIVIHFDPWWNAAAQNQATDRAHRIGQKNKVNVYSLISKNSIEEKVIQLQQSKKKLADDLLGSKKITSSLLSKQDFLRILQ